MMHKRLQRWRALNGGMRVWQTRLGEGNHPTRVGLLRLSDRGFGKPSQFVEFTHRTADALDDATFDDLQLMLAELQRQSLA